MANSIKYNTGTETNALRMGNFHMGVGDSSKGPTSTTGYYSAVNPPPGGYTIYVHNKNIGPSIQIASNDAELIRITNTIASTSYTTPSECFQYFNGQTDKMVVNQPFNFMVTDGLVLNVDAGHLSSYPTAGTTWNDLSGESNNGVLTNSPTFNSNGWIEFDGTDDEVIIPDDSTLDLTTDMSFEFVVKVDSTQNNLYPRLIDKSNWLIHLSQTSPFSIAQNINTSAGLRQTALGSLFAANKWAHIVSNYDGQYGKIYVNGELVKTSNFGSVLACNTNNTVVTVGGNTGTSRQLNGDMAVVRVYDEVLTQAEVLQNYYQGPIVTDGLIFAIDAGNLVSYENGSTTAYSLTGSLSGSLTNGTEYSSDNGGVFTFDGNDDRINNFSENIQPASISIEYWKKWTSVSDDWLIGNQTSNPIDNSNGWYSRIDSPSYNFIARFGVGSTQRSVTYNPIVLNEWTHVVTTFDPVEGAALYWNGELVNTNTNGGTLSYTNVLGLEIGGANDGSRDTPGPVGPVRIYDRALTAGEVMQNYSAGKGRFSA